MKHELLIDCPHCGEALEFEMGEDEDGEDEL